MFVFFAALLSAASAANICCSPDQWQADVLLVMGTVNKGNTAFYEGSMKMSYDAVNKIVAYDQSLSTNNFAFNQRIVADYKNGVMYTIRGGECNSTKSGVFVPSCIPDNATLTSDLSVYGFGNNSVRVKAYNAYMQGYDVNIAVTADTCIPVTETVTGRMSAPWAEDDQTEVMQALQFGNIKSGIESRSVFFVPAQCESESVKPQTVG